MVYKFKDEAVTEFGKWKHMLQRPRVMKKNPGAEAKAHTTVMMNTGTGIICFKKNMAPGAPSTFTHGHQYDALFFVLEGKGHEIHDGKRFNWKTGDANYVAPGGTVHQHYNDDPDKSARVLVFAAAPIWHGMNITADGLVELSHQFKSVKNYQDEIFFREGAQD